MTALSVYVMFVLPAIAILMGLGGLWLVQRDYDRLELQKKPIK